MDLSNLQPALGSKQSDNFRRGRGHGSGNGKTAGKGHKGQKARSGATRPGFEGGQMPLYRRIPKRGFTNRNSKTIIGINVSALEVFDNDTVVTVETLLESGIVKNPRDGVKILGNGELTKKLVVKVDAFSEGAKTKIEALGGTCEVI
ncbi:50S ribosomal protein L15 [Lacrimispora sp.]|uniref:50S ribosomal protein L15 n=1 Tax=Lacrimispora sp. TaxID=2719234 RepID=UPI003460715A